MRHFKNIFKGKRITVMGLGLLGRGLGDTIFLIECGAEVTVTDLKSPDQLRPSVERLKELPVTIKLGGHDPDDFAQADMILRNADVPASSPYLEIAKHNGIPIEMDESLFCKFFDGLVVGITGTRGKTTTTYLINHILQGAKRKTHLAGNIMGVATLPLLKIVEPEDIVVLELSSWQLQGFHEARISPQASVFTNIYPDHLNRYHGMDEYIFDKKAIYSYQKPENFCVFNLDNSVTRDLSKESKSKVIYFEINDVPKDWEIRIPGAHNLENVAAAIQTTRTLGIPENIIREFSESFGGVEHRLQWLGTRNGVDFVNDTTSTTPVSGIVALNSLSSREILLIAGGADKKLDLSEFAKIAAARTKRIALLDGSATNELYRKLAQYGAESKIAGIFKDLESAINELYRSATKGQVILLSPACASFGMFRNEFHRGESFVKIFDALEDN